MQLTICNTEIKQDSEGRYCLNDLHRAAGSERKHGPSLWLQNAQTVELVAELGDAGNPVSVTKGGTTQGTFVCKELVYHYAMWISPVFNLKVIRTFDAAQKPLPAQIAPSNPMDALKLFFAVAEQQGAQLAQVTAATVAVEVRTAALEVNLTLTHAQECQIQELVTAKVKDLGKRTKPEDIRKLYMGIYRAIKRRFQVPRYSEIPRIKFDMAVKFINSVTMATLAGF